MKVNELKAILSGAEAFLGTSGAKTGAGALRQVHDLLDGDGQKTVAAFVEETLAILPEPLESLSAKQIADRLEKAKVDNAAFAKLFGGMQARAVSKEKAIEVAALYLGGAPRWKSKPAALKAIRAGFDDRFYQASKMVFVDKGAPW
jgi:hypothetical protein